MSAVEMAIEKIRALPEIRAKALLEWLAESDAPPTVPANRGPAAARGFARRFQTQNLTTDEWMKILREGEQ